MRVAIYGAGISGLSCAFGLEQLDFHGEIDLFEEKDGVGVGNVYLNFAAELFFYRPIPDMISLLGEKYKLYLNYAPKGSAIWFQKARIGLRLPCSLL